MRGNALWEPIDSSLIKCFFALTRLFRPSVSKKPLAHTTHVLGESLEFYNTACMRRLVAMAMAGQQRCLDAWRTAVAAAQALGQLGRSLAGINIESSGGSAPCSIVARTPSERLGTKPTIVLRFYPAFRTIRSLATVKSSLQMLR